MSNNLLSVICVYNDKNVLDDVLLESIYKQSVDFEFIGIDNTNSIYKSAAQALNYGYSISNGKYLIFLHQDLFIIEKDFFKRIIAYLSNDENVILGIAGNKFGDTRVYSNIEHNVLGKKAGFFSINEPVFVDTLDEVLIAIPSNIFGSVLFDEKTCYGWHLYVADLCLVLRQRNIRPKAISCVAFHLSSGKLDSKYFETLKLLVIKHNKKFNRITTTCVNVRTTLFSVNLFVLRTFLLKFKLISIINGIKNNIIHRLGKHNA